MKEDKEEQPSQQERSRRRSESESDSGAGGAGGAEEEQERISPWLTNQECTQKADSTLYALPRQPGCTWPTFYLCLRHREAGSAWPMWAQR